MQETKICKHCQSEIDKKAKICPNCRKKQGGNIKWIVAVIVAIFIINAIANGGDDAETSNANSNQNSASETESIEPSETSSATEATEKVETEPATSAPVEETSSLTMGQKNALSKAESYLNFSSFSYSGLIEQLEFEGFSNEDATYAVDNCGADWNEQAALKAQQYLELSSFSRDGLIEQLEFEGFTSEQAEYGVTEAGY